MGVLLYSDNQTPCSGRSEGENSGFNGPYCYESGSLTTGIPFPTDKRYYDTYQYGESASTFHYRILGDATGEMGPFASKQYRSQTRQVSSWHDDEAWFVYSANLWFHRGYSLNSGTSAGVFTFGSGHGSVYSDVSFRVVLSI